MADRPNLQTWGARGLYLLVSLLIIYLSLLPMQTVPRSIVMPDLLLALALCWAARRPDFVPIWLIAFVFLLADLMFQRPPGLWTGLVLIFTEVLRTRAQGLRGMTFPLEWTTVGLGILALYVANRLIVTMTLLPPPPVVPYFVQMFATIAVYPLVSGLSYLLMGIARPAPGALDAFGNRI